MKSIFITGGAKRLGRHLVMHFASEGWRVLFTARQSFEDGVLLCSDIDESRVHCIRSDVSSRANAAMLSSWVEEKTNGDGLDAVVCSASGLIRKDVLETTESDMEDMIRSNFVGPYFIAQQMFVHLRKKGGVIVNVCDAAVERGLPMDSAYLASKAALASATKSIALAFAPHVRVNAVMPGSLPWPTSDAAESNYSQSERLSIISKIPMARIGGWGDAVMAVKHLIDAPYMNGALVPVDGGRSVVY